MKSDKKIAIMATAIIAISVFAFAFVMPASANWPGWYFKPGYDNYAPSGMPDFDQKQDKWQRIWWGQNGVLESVPLGDDFIVPSGQFIVPGPNCTLESTLNASSDDVLQWCFCGPTAVANCFWWFDSKYEKETTGVPGDGNDTCPLVEDYGVGDDHNFSNVPLLIERLASNMSTCMNGTTNVLVMEKAIDDWLNATGLNDTLYEHTSKQYPDFYWIEEEIEKSQDVILLLGFYEKDSDEYWERIGGHYVTCAGVNSNDSWIAISDPCFDNAVAGRPGWTIPSPHPDAGNYTSTFHNDAKNISHDFYNVTPGPFFVYWYLQNYPVSVNASLVKNFQEMPFGGGSIQTVIEYAVVISPKPKPAIEVNKTVLDPETGEWVKELNASLNETLRFNCTIHNSGDFNLSKIRFWDILDCSLNYSDDATLNGAGIVLYGNYVFKPKVLHPDNLSWDPYNPLLSTPYELFSELCPEQGHQHELWVWEDTNEDGRISECDQVYLYSGAVWYHVENVPYTLNVTNIDTEESMYIDSVLDYEAVNLSDPNGTEWMEVCCCKDSYNLTYWNDTNSNGELDKGDIIHLLNKRLPPTEWVPYLVNNVTKDLVVSKEWEINELLDPGELILEPCKTITIEFNAQVVKCGVDNNTQFAKGWCDETQEWVYDNDTVTITVPCVSGEATDAAGGTKDVYYTDEIVYATGSGFVPGSLVNIYITEDKHWEDGMAINSTVYVQKNNVNVSPDGTIVGEEMWPNPIPGEYDMVFDANQNGHYDVGIDAVDHPNHPGFTVLGRARVPVLTPTGIAALVGLLAIVATSVILGKRKR